MLIQITAEHIRHGKKGSPGACPIALAIMEKCYDVYVATDYLQVKKQPGGYFTDMQFPKAVETFIQEFDAGKEVSPFSFTLRAKKEG